MQMPRASRSLPPQPARSPIDRGGSEWFLSHYDEAATDIITFFARDGLSLEGKVIGDVGCGDGIIDLGLFEKARPAQLVGFDIVPTDRAWLLQRASREGVATELPRGLEFRTSELTRLSADTDEFDFLVSWSAFEHVAEPIPLLRDMRRVLKPDGVLMIQIWPFFHTQHGAHLWEWIDEEFVQLLRSDEAITELIENAPGSEKDKAPALRDWVTVNRITADGLQSALLAAGFGIGKVELLTNAFHIPPQLVHMPLSLLGIGGVQLLASPSPGG